MLIRLVMLMVAMGSSVWLKEYGGNIQTIFWGYIMVRRLRIRGQVVPPACKEYLLGELTFFSLNGLWAS